MHYHESTSSIWDYFQYCSSTMGMGSSTTAVAAAGGGGRPLIMERIERMASENAVVIFSINSCCMCHAIKRLFCGMGVNPTVYELDQLDPISTGKEIQSALMSTLNNFGSSTSGAVAVLPVVFIGAKLVRAMDRVMASHINGTLVLLLKDAGALWL